MDCACVLFAYRSAVQQSLMETPFYLLYGRVPRIPIDVTLLPKQREMPMTKYRKELVKNLVPAQSLIKRNIFAQETQKYQYYKDSKQKKFGTREKVLLKWPTVQPGKPTRLAPKYIRPFRIIIERMSRLDYK